MAKIIMNINNIAIIWQIYWGNIYLPICKDWNKNYKTNLSQFQKIGIKTIKQIYWNFRKLG
jgi:hypothetical protein